MTLVVGVVNVTPDSFSDGGSLPTAESAIAHGLHLASLGAAIIDVGGESTKPGTGRITEKVEAARVLPVVAALAGHGLHVSVDTMRASIASAAVEAGARTINDVSGGLADPRMLPLAAEAEVDYVAMHWRAHSRQMQAEAVYDDVVAEVIEELLLRRDAALSAGIREDRIILDPGIGFSKLGRHNWALLRNLPRLNALGHRLLVGASRKRFLGTALGGRQPCERDAATAAISSWSAQHGVWGVRTHEVSMQLDAIRVGALLGGSGPI